METKEEGEVERPGFSSEHFKIEINGLPKFFNVGEAKKLLVKKLGLNVHKFKPVGKNARYMFVNFSNEEERGKAIDKLDGYQLKGAKLRAFPAKAAKDPMARGRTAQEPVDDGRTVDEKIRHAVCQLSKVPYDEQLRLKLADVQGLMDRLRKDLRKQLPVLDENAVALVDPFVPSPVVDGYRNKCEFTVGRHPETNEPTVGFRLASYKKGSVAVAAVETLPIVSDEMKKVVLHFESFVRSSGHDPYDHASHRGFWRQLTVRSCRGGHLMAWAILHPQQLASEERKALAEKLKDHFGSSTVTSLHVQFLGQKAKGDPDPPVEHLSGSTSISETLMGGRLTFEISPRSFFQVNVEAAEKLYAACAEMAKLDPERSVLYDVCCGTGTIGLCLADRCKKVVGVDVVEEAIVNARKNAEANGIANAEYHAGRAEHVLPELLKREPEDAHVVAVVDPPRAGLHPKAVTALRAASNIRTVVYVSCDAKAAMQSFLGLGRPPSNTFAGDPFVPRKVVPVDLFPHTKHFELVVLFERLPLTEKVGQMEQEH